MPTRDNAPTGTPCWVDLSTSDADQARAFYGALLGWEAEDPNPEFGGYMNFTKGGVRVGGCMAKEPGNPMPDAWGVYLATDDAAKTVEVAAANGATVIVPAMEVGDLGSMALFVDPTGAFIGVWQAGEHKGFGIEAEPGAPSWFELMTRDYDGALDFYRTVFGWETHSVADTEEFRYSTVVEGEEWHAGVADARQLLPEGVPPHWTVYFGVADADAAVAQAVELGGAVLRPAEDTPYGRIALLADPAGATFHVVAANEQMPAK